MCGVEDKVRDCGMRIGGKAGAGEPNSFVIGLGVRV